MLISNLSKILTSVCLKNWHLLGYWIVTFLIFIFYATEKATFHKDQTELIGRCSVYSGFFI